jgi:glucose-1-phosphate thymidylyltransferase
MKKQTLKNRKGIILAGGKGSRLFPLTQIISKQLLPVYNKPMIFYSLSVLMLANIRDILIISDPINLPILKKFLGQGKDFGINISYGLQTEPKGIAEAFLIGEKFIKNSPVALILGDNIFFGHRFGEELEKISSFQQSSIFLYKVPDPERFGVAQVTSEGKVIRIDEKPKKPRSNYAITGLYFYDEEAIHLVKQLQYSKRGELEITDLNNLYLKEKKLFAHFLSRGFSWYDTGTFDSLNDASNIIRLTEQRQGIRIGYPYEIALRKKWISINDLHEVKNQLNTEDIKYLHSVL